MASANPYDKLSDELCLAVFQIYVQEGRSTWIETVPGYQLSKPRNTTPFTLSAVCKHWRALCLATTTLWSTIYLEFPPFDFASDREGSDGENDDEDDVGLVVTETFVSHVDALQKWIERARSRPLSITIQLQEQHMSINFKDATALRIPRMLVDRAKQLEALDTFLSDKWYPFFDGVDFPILKTLKLWIPEMWPQDGTFDSEIRELAQVAESLDLTSCPQLTSISTDGSYQEHSNITLPWSQITDVHAGWIRPLVYLEILDLMPNVKRCTLDGDAMYESDPVLEGEDIDALEEMGRREGNWDLRSLTIRYFDNAIVKALLDRTPLTLKDVALQPSNSIYAADGLLDSLVPFSASLQSFTIVQTFINCHDKLLDVLKQLNGLVSLDAPVGTDDRGIDDDFLTALAEPGVLPRLERLSIRTTKLAFREETLLSFLRAHGYSSASKTASTCAMIRQLKLNGKGVSELKSTAAEIVDELRRAVKGGLDLSVGHLVRPEGGGGPDILVPWFAL